MHRLISGGNVAGLLGLLATGCSSDLPDAPDDLDTLEAGCRDAATSLALDDGSYLLDVVAYAGAMWTVETPLSVVDGLYTRLGPEVTVNQRSCDGGVLNTSTLSRGLITLRYPVLLPLDGAMLVVGTEVLTGDTFTGDAAVWAYDIDTFELIAAQRLDLPSLARFSEVLDADLRDGILTVAVRHPAPDEERVALVAFADPLAGNPGIPLASYPVDPGQDVEIADLAVTGTGQSLWWQTQWPIWDQYLARDGGEAALVDVDFTVDMSSSGDQDWMLYGPTVEDLNTGATMVAPPDAYGITALTTGPVVRSEGWDSPPMLLVYDLELNLIDTLPLEQRSVGLVDLGEGAAFIRYADWGEDGLFHETFDLLPHGGE